MSVIAVLSSDLHFSHKAPSARAEKDWYAVMSRYIFQIKTMLDTWKVPWIVAGDYLDKWNSPPELINFLIDVLPESYGIPGQHDLPLHRYEDESKSGYGTLVRAGRIRPIQPGTILNPYQVSSLFLHGFPWGFEITPCKRIKEGIHLAVAHSYIWKEGFEYSGVSKDSHISEYQKKLVGYDAALFGDNHQGFLIDEPRRPNVLNCGTFMRRKRDERPLKPQVGLLLEDGTIEIRYLKVSKDLWTEEVIEEPQNNSDSKTSDFLEGLKGLGSDSLDFRDAVKRHMDSKGTDQSVREIVCGALDDRGSV